MLKNALFEYAARLSLLSHTVEQTLQCNQLFEELLLAMNFKIASYLFIYFNGPTVRKDQSLKTLLFIVTLIY